MFVINNCMVNNCKIIYVYIRVIYYQLKFQTIINTVYFLFLHQYSISIINKLNSKKLKVEGGGGQAMIT